MRAATSIRPMMPRENVRPRFAPDPDPTFPSRKTSATVDGPGHLACAKRSHIIVISLRGDLETIG
jgi:hypothetical protein